MAHKNPNPNQTKSKTAAGSKKKGGGKKKAAAKKPRKTTQRKPKEITFPNEVSDDVRAAALTQEKG